MTTATDKIVVRAARYAREKYNKLRETEEYRHCHDSFAVRDALLATEAKYPDLGTFGVESGKLESTGEYVTYLNTGDTYGYTVLYFRGRFQTGTWGDIVEHYDL